MPRDRTIDGLDVSTLLLDERAPSPRQSFWYHLMNDLEAVRAGRWKLHLAKAGERATGLYDVVADPAESIDRSRDSPDHVTWLTTIVDEARRSLGDARMGIAAADRRPLGRVDDPRHLTRYDPAHPYFAAEYDLPDRG